MERTIRSFGLFVSHYARKRKKGPFYFDQEENEAFYTLWKGRILPDFAI